MTSGSDFAALAGNGGHRKEESVSGEAILAVFIPTFITAVVYLAIFAAIRNYYRKIYAPRTFLGPVPEKDRTPSSRPGGQHWFHDFRTLQDRFVLQHNSLDAYLYLRFLKLIIGLCVLGCCMSWPILLPINVNGGGASSQLDRLSFSNVTDNKLTWAHSVVAWGFFLAVFFAVAWERLQLIGIRQACYLNEAYANRLSSRTVLFMNAPRAACQPDNLKEYFGEEADKCWPVTDTGDLETLTQQRNDAAYALESAQIDLIVKSVKRAKKAPPMVNGNGVETGHGRLPKVQRPIQRNPPVIGQKVDAIEAHRRSVTELVEKIDAHRSAPSRSLPEQSAVFVSFTDQAAAHRAFQMITFQPKVPIKDRFLAVQPKEVLWKNLEMPLPMRLSKASLALVFVVVFTIFFSIPVGIIGSISNIKAMSERYSWLHWVQNLSPAVIGLLSGLVPPFLTSWFVSYVPKLFRHIAKLSGEPTTPQAELKTQAWYFVFQVFQIFLVTTFSSGAAAVVQEIAQNPASVPQLLASSLPSASNFYLTYFILQGTASAASTVLNYSDLFEYIFYEKFWDKTPREKFATHSYMKGTPWASWYPKFTTFLIIAIVYACIAPLVLGFAAAGLALYYLSYRYQLMYVVLTKIDTKGEAYARALKQIPTGIYLAELCLIGLFGLRGAVVQSVLMVLFLIFTATLNLVLNRTLRTLELYLGVDIWEAQEPELARQDGVDPHDEQALHGSSHIRRLGLGRLPGRWPRFLSDLADGIISGSQEKIEAWLDAPAARLGEARANSDSDTTNTYLSPAMISKTPKLWLAKDQLGVSKQEIDENEAEGIPTTDDGAEVDEDGRLHWDHDFDNVPIYKRPQLI